MVDLAKAEADAAGRAEDLRRRLAALDDDVEHAADIAARIEALAAEVEEQRGRVADYDRRGRAVDGLLHERDAARARAEAAENSLGAARDELARRQARAAAVEAAERRHGELAAEHARHQPALDAARAAVDAAEARLVAALGEARAADEGVRARQADLALANDHLFLEQMTERLARVEAAQAEIAALERLLEDNRVGPAELTAVEDANLALVQARARVEGESPVVEVEALGPVVVGIDGDARRLHEGERVVASVAAETTVVVGDAARLVVRGGREAGGLAAAVMDAERLLAEACADAGVADVAEARAAAAARRDAAGTSAHLAERLQADLRDLTPERLAGKVDSLRARVAAAGDRQACDIDSARRQVEAAEGGARQAAEAAREAEHEASLRRDALERLRRQVEASAREVDIARRQADTAREDLAAGRARVPDGVLAGRVEAAEARSAEARAALHTAEAAAERARPEDLRLALDNASKVLDKLVAEHRGAEQDHAAIRARLDALGEQGLHDRLAEAEAEAEHARRRRAAEERRAAAAKRLYDTLARCRAEARQAYVAPLRAKIEAFGRIVFGDDFSVELGEDLRILRRTVRGVTVDFDQLSMGAREQLCVISRLACAAIVAADEGVPVILDDALGWSDGRRLERLGAVLSLAAAEAQVIVLTCLPERYRHVGSATVVRLGGA